MTTKRRVDPVPHTQAREFKAILNLVFKSETFLHNPAISEVQVRKSESSNLMQFAQSRLVLNVHTRNGERNKRR